MISIVIPIYNQAQKLRACLDSLLKQTYQDYEVIIVNDGSTDDLSTVLLTYQDKFAKWQVIQQANQGANPARNRGATATQGEFLLFCDADIIYSPSCWN
jgi:glycosyltransferase involved in cell wall biosynthesis